MISLKQCALKRLINPFGYQSFVLTEGSRARVLEKFPPKFTRVQAHHITFLYGARLFDPLPSAPRLIQVHGYVADDSLECLSVLVDGELHRTDGNVYHITLSHEPHRKPFESNDLLNRTSPVRVSKVYLAAASRFTCKF